MTRPVFRPVLLTAVIGSVPVVAVVLSVLYWSDAVSDADRASADTAAVQKLVDHIRSARPPADPDLDVPVARVVQDALREAKIPPPNVDPPTPAASDAVAYFLSLRRVSVRQSLELVSILLKTPRPIRVQQFHLSHPVDGSPTLWDVDLTLTDPTTHPAPSPP